MPHATRCHQPNSKDRSSLKIGLYDKFRTRENTTNPVIEIPKKHNLCSGQTGKKRWQNQRRYPQKEHDPQPLQTQHNSWAPSGLRMNENIPPPIPDYFWTSKTFKLLPTWHTKLQLIPVFSFQPIITILTHKVLPSLKSWLVQTSTKEFEQISLWGIWTNIALTWKNSLFYPSSGYVENVIIFCDTCTFL